MTAELVVLGDGMPDAATVTVRECSGCGNFVVFVVELTSGSSFVAVSSIGFKT